MIQSIQNRLPLADGTSIPALGLGCYKLDNFDAAIRAAAEAGVRYFDSAAYYQNEPAVGHALRGCGVPRDRLYLLSKIWPTDYDHPERSLETTLRDLGTDYLDCCLLHWPGGDRDARLRAWEYLLNARERGLVRSVGVSNFLEKHLTDLITACGEAPVIDQLELHPFRQQAALTAFCRAQSILPVAWAPLARSLGREDPTVAAVAAAHGKTPAQILLRWQLEHGHACIPKSSNPDRIRSNTELFDFALLPDERAALDALERRQSVANVNPLFADA